MTRERLTLALERLGSGEWKVFEEFAADFLSVDYPSLRTMAAAGGDKGRDGQMYRPSEEASVMVQYSVASDWKSKITQTVKRLQENLQDIDRLIYATSKRIGPEADNLVFEMLREQGISLDIRDISWFVERRETHPQRISASATLCDRIVEPLLRRRGLSDRVGLSLNEGESRLGLLHLSLQIQDDAGGKGLTKESFESLTLSALHDSDSENTIERAEVQRRVASFLPAGHEQQIIAQVDSALARMSGKRGIVKYHKSVDRFCLSHQERVSLDERVAKFVLSEELLENELWEVVESHYDVENEAPESETIGRELRASMEWILLRQGEIFVNAARSGETSNTAIDDLVQIIAEEPGRKTHGLPRRVVAQALMSVLTNPGEDVKEHLRRLADGYTLFAFMRQTPDVQKVVVNLFSDGEFWLDTSIILPLIAETLVDDPASRHYTVIFRAALDAGIDLYVTDGVIEEVERHLNRCVMFSRSEANAWNGSTPFVYAAYAMDGRARNMFAGWLEDFVGDSRPEEDVREYLEDVHSIKRRNLTEECENASMEFWSAVQEEWSTVHERRRNSKSAQVDVFATQQLVAHDTENYVGVTMLRSKGSPNPMGYRQWFVTLDKEAFGLRKHLIDRLDSPPPSPVLSPDFLSQFLRLGPLRSAIEREVRINLPVLTDVSRFDYIPKQLIEAADDLRADLEGKSERIIQRRVRDSLDKMRMRMGEEAAGGSYGMEKRVMSLLKNKKSATGEEG
ncbi:hypothetical protein [Streptomyces sp. KO7888]|uniref:hypothetical protein n=1 Tax=Streptomyces sp. KO7888 TaxID=2602737 RepID=UPI0013F5E5B6|nr:hypothetical protein [Streptomyces sp. KO7888]